MTCDSCLKSHAFSKPQGQREKVGGKRMCRICTQQYKLRRNAARKQKRKRQSGDSGHTKRHRGKEHAKRDKEGASTTANLMVDESDVVKQYIEESNNLRKQLERMGDERDEQINQRHALQIERNRLRDSLSEALRVQKDERSRHLQELRAQRAEVDRIRVIVEPRAREAEESSRKKDVEISDLKEKIRQLLSHITKLKEQRWGGCRNKEGRNARGGSSFAEFNFGENKEIEELKAKLAEKEIEVRKDALVSMWYYIRCCRDLTLLLLLLTPLADQSPERTKFESWGER